ncbi:hypothetical protein ACFSC6_12600 [Rufibacter sediminis]|uniref:Uncharacterized protein n=1 Tax=Rufibacter sediminis TaxID=2762756 RepID=A0ABR6VU32_9BACT|nr:hypothetical protein [Rufibacter sediminis]MBC3540722.1 hypothetical protein [Rufibacter sediminis]
MEIAFLLIALVVIVCCLLTITFLLGYLLKRVKSRARNAAVSFLVAVVALSSFLLIEELFFSYNTEDKEEVLVAHREAPIGGILLKLYADRTFELGGFRKVETTGTFEVKQDTLFITSTNNPKVSNQFNSRSFLIKENHLEETTDTGIGILAIHKNSLK